MKNRLHFRLLLPICCVAVAAVSSVLLPSRASADPVDFLGFTQEDYPLNSFPRNGWIVTQDGLSAGPVYNGSPSVFYSPANILGQKITGRVYPANRVLTGESAGNGDDDIWGFVLGFEPGDATSTGADYLLLDWKRVTQTFDFIDRPGMEGTFHDLTEATTASAGLFLSRVNGLPNADELWSKEDLIESPSGGVTFVASGATLGGIGYGIGDQFHDFEIHYEADRVQIWVNDVLEFDVAGTFGSGRFGLYQHSQDAVTTYTAFDIESLGATNVPGDFDGDFDVDGADFVVWQTNFPTPSGATLDTGDADGDGDVDGADFVVWQTNFPTAPPGGASPVPEPNAFLIAGLGMLGLAILGKRKG